VKFPFFVVFIYYIIFHGKNQVTSCDHAGALLRTFLPGARLWTSCTAYSGYHNANNKRVSAIIDIFSYRKII